VDGKNPRFSDYPKRYERNTTAQMVGFVKKAV
jgi:hypothetical protein